MFFFFFASTTPLLSTPMDETLFLLWFKLHLIVSVTGALSYQGPAAPTEKKKKKKQERGGREGGGGGFIKAGARWTQQQWIKVFCMIKSLPRGGINLICERMLLRGNKVPKSSVILFLMS